jgi:hypothetical protein
MLTRREHGTQNSRPEVVARPANRNFSWRLGAFARALIVKKFLTQRRNGAKEATELFLFTENQKTNQKTGQV